MNTLEQGGLYLESVLSTQPIIQTGAIEGIVNGPEPGRAFGVVVQHDMLFAVIVADKQSLHTGILDAGKREHCKRELY